MTPFSMLGFLVDQPCFVESNDQEPLIAAARILEISENGGALLCESGEDLPAGLYSAVLVALQGHRIQRVAIMLSPVDQGSSVMVFSKIAGVRSQGLMS